MKRELQGRSAAHAPLDVFPTLPNLGSTESSPVWQGVFFHCLQNQIPPDRIRSMRRADLSFVAGHLESEAALWTEEVISSMTRYRTGDPPPEEGKTPTEIDGN